jgi:hypothetical protein
MLMFVCPRIQKAFDSGFRFSANDFAKAPAGYRLTVRCRTCLHTHEFSLADGWIAPAGPIPSGR